MNSFYTHQPIAPSSAFLFQSYSTIKPVDVSPGLDQPLISANQAGGELAFSLTFAPYYQVTVCDRLFPSRLIL